ncbi:hypothetical protein AXF42_Ash015775 [Apostasia shenzhenica]|uniref:Uncharacterized protein n=1 Tax=Apostasia shenzhenica TaxID=1088818 RepID=A0A2H9ZXM3_9ASPA|nr:hypothetical protein AXF42_Ash015775 [Apostasia shenzhenica]
MTSEGTQLPRTWSEDNLKKRQSILILSTQNSIVQIHSGILYSCRNSLYIHRMFIAFFHLFRHFIFWDSYDIYIYTEAFILSEARLARP